ncbi:MAG: hypothetical protein H0A76_00220 [Candidatus Thiodubiliella endoseptemdiera]|uniref:VCBS repeat-containing protein n=1 Tax=Candidatus Thiodubiliella endoseptemdiera TaxID=2738886 RepID=A0A853EYH0_9GAMM|nr:hypothetical protein [Candidatus Thiodubiliella endoseptemdiera]
MGVFFQTNPPICGDGDLIWWWVSMALLNHQNKGLLLTLLMAKNGEKNLFKGIDVGYSFSPTPGNIDGDGDPDLVVVK